MPNSESTQARPPVLSVVTPIYRAAVFLDRLVELFSLEASSITASYEIILVDDGSPDDSWTLIKQHCQRDPRIKGIKLSRNFGQHYALTAGLFAAAGQHIIVLDGDLQDDPAYFRPLYEKAKEGNEIVFTAKATREHSRLKNLTASVFYSVFNWLVSNRSLKLRKDVGNYSLISRKVLDAFLSIKDSHRYYLLVLSWLGFKSTIIEIEHLKRAHGKSNYTTARLVSLAINCIVSQSDRLLYLSVGAGFFLFLLSFVGAAALIVLYFTHGIKEGWTSVMVVLLSSTGLILISLGILGIYLGKTFEQTKERPLYIVDEKLNLTPSHS